MRGTQFIRHGVNPRDIPPRWSKAKARGTRRLLDQLQPRRAQTAPGVVPRKLMFPKAYAAIKKFQLTTPMSGANARAE